jgi:hypothetical protein
MKDSYFIFINLCLLYRGLNSGPNLEPLYQTFFVIFFFEIGSPELFAQAGFQPPDLCLLSS